MPKRISHVSYLSPRSTRVFSGEKVGKRVAGWLSFGTDELTKKIYRAMNAESSHRLPQRRVEEILHLYERLRECRTVEDLRKVPLRKLTRSLRRYSYYPYFFPSTGGSDFHWTPTKKKPHEELYDDTDAIFDLMELARQGLLERLKQCPCGRWIWARFSHQRFCSSKCRERDFRSSEKWKEHRRQKAREYYRLHKSGKVK
jgi:hypothetical protein